MRDSFLEFHDALRQNHVYSPLWKASAPSLSNMMDSLHALRVCLPRLRG